MGEVCWWEEVAGIKGQVGHDPEIREESGVEGKTVQNSYQPCEQLHL